MIETLFMLASLVVLGYVFYLSSRMLWVHKSSEVTWRWAYGIISGFVFVTYFLLGVLMFFFAAASIVSPTILNVLNIVVSLFFLSGSGLIGAVMRYHISIMQSFTKEQAKSNISPKEKPRKVRK